MQEKNETKVFKNGDAVNYVTIVLIEHALNVSTFALIKQITTVTKITNYDGNRLDERIVTSTVFGDKQSLQHFNNLTDAQFRGTVNFVAFLLTCSITV